MNGSRVLLAGTVAGLVFNVGGMASAWLMGLPESFARFGLEPTAGAALLHLGLRFGLGLATVSIYAGMTRGVSPSRGTAIQVGVLVWFVGYVPGSAVLHELGVLSGRQLLFALGWGVAEAVTAAVTGAWLYTRGRSHVAGSGRRSDRAESSFQSEVEDDL